MKVLILKTMTFVWKILQVAAANGRRTLFRILLQTSRKPSDSLALAEQRSDLRDKVNGVQAIEVQGRRCDAECAEDRAKL